MQNIDSDWYWFWLMIIIVMGDQKVLKLLLKGKLKIMKKFKRPLLQGHYFLNKKISFT